MLLLSPKGSNFAKYLQSTEASDNDNYKVMVNKLFFYLCGNLLMIPI